VPNGYEGVVRVGAPEPTAPEWWSAYRQLFEDVAAIGLRHTSSADDEDRRRNEAVRVGLLVVPTFDLPGRTYHLLRGAVTAVGQLRHPGSPDDWRNPDLFWPPDRRRFVATDVDFWSLYVGGSEAFITEVAAGVAASTELIPLDRQLETED
jgi:hypothetical protein